MKSRVAWFVVAAAMTFPSQGFSETTYVLSFNKDEVRSLNVSVRRPENSPATELIYRGSKIAMGIKAQIENPTCDDAPLKPDAAPGIWFVPAGCRKVLWQVPFDPPGIDDVTAQRSIASADNSFRLFSQASSLATLADASPPWRLSVPQTDSGLTIPAPQSDGTLALPGVAKAPLFILLGSKPAATARSGRVSVSYFIDDARQVEHVAPISTTLRGLQWLAGLVPDARNTNFYYVWLGLSSGTPSMGGATGSDLLLINYIRDGSHDPTAKTLLTAVPLMEATHQFGQGLGTRMGWAEESLITYFGLEALHHARPEDDAPSQLIQKFGQDAQHFPWKLLEAQRRVSEGDQGAYPTYFTKGVAFWAAVDQTIRVRNTGGLAEKLQTILKMKFDPNGEPPPDFAESLGISQERWKALKDQFLGS